MRVSFIKIEIDMNTVFFSLKFATTKKQGEIEENYTQKSGQQTFKSQYKLLKKVRTGCFPLVPIIKDV